MKKILAKIIWELSEFTGIGLGRFAPIIFGAMVGCEGDELTDELANTQAQIMDGDKFVEWNN